MDGLEKDKGIYRGIQDHKVQFDQDKMWQSISGQKRRRRPIVFWLFGGLLLFGLVAGSLLFNETNSSFTQLENQNSSTSSENNQVTQDQSESHSKTLNQSFSPTDNTEGNAQTSEEIEGAEGLIESKSENQFESTKTTDNSTQKLTRSTDLKRESAALVSEQVGGHSNSNIVIASKDIQRNNGSNQEEVSIRSQPFMPSTSNSVATNVATSSVTTRLEEVQNKVAASERSDETADIKSKDDSATPVDPSNDLATDRIMLDHLEPIALLTSKEVDFAQDDLVSGPLVEPLSKSKYSFGLYGGYGSLANAYSGSGVDYVQARDTKESALDYFELGLRMKRTLPGSLYIAAGLQFDQSTTKSEITDEESVIANLENFDPSLISDQQLVGVEGIGVMVTSRTSYNRLQRVAIPINLGVNILPRGRMSIEAGALFGLWSGYKGFVAGQKGNIAVIKDLPFTQSRMGYHAGVNYQFLVVGRSMSIGAQLTYQPSLNVDGVVEQRSTLGARLGFNF